MANVTSSGNTTIKPTINAAKFMGSSHAAGSALENQIVNINLSLSNLAGDIRKNLASINSITEILDSHSHIDDENDVNNTNNENESKLDEISNILLDIGNAMSLDFANRIAENNEDISDTKKQKSKGKFGRAESGIEKQKQKKVGNIFTNTASKAASPVSGIFGKLLSLVGILGLGALANAGFEWLKKKENRERLDTFFNIIQKNWKWMLGTAGILVGARILIELTTTLTALGAVFALLTNPLVLKFLAFLGVGIAGYKIGKPIHDARVEADDKKRKKLQEEGNLSDGEIEVLIEGTRTPDAGGSGSINHLRNKTFNPTAIPGDFDYKRFHKGGIVTGPTNEVPAILERGELVIPKQEVATLSQNPKKSGMNFIPINLPTITKTPPQLPALSSVATNVVHISSKNVSDPYRQLTPDIYGIYV